MSAAKPPLKQISWRAVCELADEVLGVLSATLTLGLFEGCPSFVQDVARIDRNECGFPDGCDYPPANFVLATGRANAFVGPCPLLAITLP